MYCCCFAAIMIRCISVVPVFPFLKPIAITQSLENGELSIHGHKLYTGLLSAIVSPSPFHQMESNTILNLNKLSDKTASLRPLKKEIKW